MKLGKDFTNTFLYFIFEGISKGGNYLLLLFIASFLSEALYIKIFLLLSLEIVLTMLYISYYGEVLYGYNLNKVSFRKLFFSSMYLFSSFQFLVFSVLYALFFANIFAEYYEYENKWVILLILFNGFLVNIIRLYATYFQLMEEHKKAIFFRSVPFAFTFVIVLLFFLLGQDKVLSFFLGKMLGLLLFVLFAFIREESIKIFYFSKETFIFCRNIFKKSKYAFVIGVLGWLSGMGFPYFVKVFGNENDTLLLGYIINIFVLIQFISFGINQVYSPRLKKLYDLSFGRTFSLSRKYHIVYMCIVCFLLIIWKLVDVLLNIFVNEQVLQKLTIWIDVFPYALLVFFFNTFHWITTPYYYIRNEFKKLFMINILSNIIGWLAIFMMLKMFKLNNFILFYQLLWGITMLVPYLNIRYELWRVKK